MGSLRADDPTTIGGYTVRGRLGAGGMGVVYLADGPNGPVAVKQLRREYVEERSLRERFRREAAALKLVDAAFTARVLDVDVDAPDPYLVMEYVDGPSLYARVNSLGPLSARTVRALAVGLASALVAIHEAGIVHRDLKPSNVLLSDHGPKVIDFGIAQLADATSLTETGVAVGSPVYMAPEQIDGQPGPYSDVFTWALTVAFAATGRLPFGNGLTQAVMFRILQNEPDLEGVPTDLQPLLRAALTKEPTDRPTAAELVAALAVEETTVAIRRNDAIAALVADMWEMPVGTAQVVRGRRWVAFGAAGVAVVAAAALAVVLMINTGGDGQVANQPTTQLSTPTPIATTASTTTASGGFCTANDIPVGETASGKPDIGIPHTCKIPTQLLTKTLKPGSGAGAKPGDKISVNYALVTWSDGKKVDSSYDKGEPFEVTSLGRGDVIKGWDQGLVGAQQGSRLLMIVPPALAYGNTGREVIKANETMVFVIDVIAVSEGRTG
jgi:predicted Ser/Thr protein kinase